MTGCDSSFLHSLYLIDTHTREPRARVKLIRDPADRIALSPFHQYELQNAIRLSVFRGLRDAVAGDAILVAFQTDQDDGRFALPTCNLAVVLSEAQRLSSSSTMCSGSRG